MSGDHNAHQKDQSDTEFDAWWAAEFDGCPDPQKFVAQDAWEAAENQYHQKIKILQEINDALVKDADKAYSLLRRVLDIFGDDWDKADPVTNAKWAKLANDLTDEIREAVNETIK